MRSLLRNICWVASAGCLLMACGPETPPDRVRVVVPPPPPPPPIVTLTSNGQTLAVGQMVTLRATFSGDDKPVLVWSHHCESGSVAMAIDPLGTSATITAERAGACIVGVSLDHGQAYASAWIPILPLPLGDACELDSECAADAPVCGESDPSSCKWTCTRTCSADADCPAPFKCAVSQHLCQAINYPQNVCD
jgi:hypothetical protein